MHPCNRTHTITANVLVSYRFNSDTTMICHFLQTEFLIVFFFCLFFGFFFHFCSSCHASPPPFFFMITAFCINGIVVAVVADGRKIESVIIHCLFEFILIFSQDSLKLFPLTFSLQNKLFLFAFVSFLYAKIKYQKNVEYTHDQ